MLIYFFFIEKKMLSDSTKNHQTRAQIYQQTFTNFETKLIIFFYNEITESIYPTTKNNE